MKQTGGRGKPQPTPRRRRRLPRRVKRGALWLLLAIVVAGGYGAILASRTPAGQATLTNTIDRVIAATAGLGLVVTDIEITGRETTDVATVMAALAAARGTPILAISPARAKEQLEALPWVRSATIERRLPSILFVRLIERHPLALWQHDKMQQLIDRDGTVIPVDDLSRFAHLPVVVGDGAATSAAALIDMLAREPELAQRVRAAVWIGDRRWDVHFDNGVDVKLPAESPQAAWSELARIEREQKLLARDIAVIDMRLPDRLVIRLGPTAVLDRQPGNDT